MVPQLLSKETQYIVMLEKENRDNKRIDVKVIKKVLICIRIFFCSFSVNYKNLGLENSLCLWSGFE